MCGDTKCRRTQNVLIKISRSKQLAGSVGLIDRIEDSRDDISLISRNKQLAFALQSLDPDLSFLGLRCRTLREARDETSDLVANPRNGRVLSNNMVQTDTAFLRIEPPSVPASIV